MIKWWWISAIVVLMGVAGVSAMPSLEYRYTHRTPGRISECPSNDGGKVKPSNQTEKIQATKVVFKPWKGRHHVYGVFVIPAGYQPTSVFKVSTDNAGEYCGAIEHNLPQGDGGMVVGKLRTRTALWLLSRGEQDRLKQPQNWTLSITREVPQNIDRAR